MQPADEQLLRRAIRLAMNGRGHVEPNPMVACVLVRDGQILGEGFHAKFGGPHAEPTALADCRARGNDPAGATAYVTLEPCCHLNKKTPPCAPQLIAAKIARVVIGCLDPNPDVNGKSAAMLRAAGIEVDGPLLEAEAKQLIAPFLAGVDHNRPYVTLKWAETADGRISGPGGARLQISNAASSRLVHQLRSRCDAIMVGIGTVLADDPVLTVRDVPPLRRPMRVVLDRQLRLPLESRLVQSKDTPTLVLSGPIAEPEIRARVAPLLAAGVRIVAIAAAEGNSGVSLTEALHPLGVERWTHLLVEPGPNLARSFFAADAADRLWVFRSRRRVDDASALAAPTIPVHFVETGRIDIAGDTLVEYLNSRSDTCFAVTPSADFVLAQGK
jgi:diaminohydroxyphosphoribosylaminopyrimidine deaminase/5-amino-6-(5-phosphoribosylamino)uracil reductase